MADDLHRDDELTPAEEQLLDNWIRRSRPSDGAGFERPDEESIIRYLDGTASDFQLRRMRRAIEASPDFRRELLKMAQEFDQLSGAQAPLRTEESQLATPALETIKSRLRSAKGDASATTSRPENLRKVSLRERLFGRSAQALIPWAVAATMTIVVIGQNVFRGSQPLRLLPLTELSPEGQIEKSLFVRMNTRSTSQQDASPARFQVYPTAREAAERRLTELIEFRISDGQYVVHPAQIVDTSQRSSRNVQLTIVGNSQNTLAETAVGLPEIADSSKSSAELWMIGLPSHVLARSQLPFDTLGIVWPNASDSLAGVVVTYPTDSGYAAISGQMIRLVHTQRDQ